VSHPQGDRSHEPPALCLIGPVHAQGLAKPAFHDALIGAMTDRSLRNVTLQGEQLKMQELPNVSPLGAYRVNLKAAINLLDDGTYQLTAQHDYGASAGSSAHSRLASTLGNARFMICDIHTAMELSDHDHWKSLRKTKLGEVDRGTFITLYPLLKDPGYEVKGDGSGGNWAFKLSSDLTAQVENFVTEMKAWVSIKLPAVPDAAGLAAMHARLRALSPSHGAVRIESVDPGANGLVWVALVFSYASMTGDDFADTLKDLVNDKELIDFQKRARRAALDGG
jgi:hypothetical protein